MDFGLWALDNKKFVNFIVVILVIGGMFAFYDMSKLEDPEIKVKQALIVTKYPGASAYEVELEVTDPLEKAIKKMQTVDYIQSRSMNDVSFIEVNLLTTVPQDELEQEWDLLRRKINDAQDNLPSGAYKPVVMDYFGDVFGMFYAITSEGFSDQEMEQYLSLLQREIQAIDGISNISIYGVREKCINIEIMQDKMSNMGVHPLEILSTLQGQNESVYSGYFDSGDNRIRVNVSNRYKKISDIENLILQGHEDDQLYLKDIARIYTSYVDPVRNELLYNGAQAYGFSIAAQKGTDITKLGTLVEEKLQHLKETRIPLGIEFHKVFFQPERVIEALSTFLINLIESILIVVIVLMFTMGFKSGMIIGLNLFIIVFGSFVILNIFDGTLQRVSLGAFILAMGMLVDNAIVIIDGILVDMNKGVDRIKALTNIGKKTAIPLLGATLIAILAFFPIFVSPDVAGTYVRDLFIVLAVSLSLSWILALTIVPIYANKSLTEVKQSNEQMYNSKYYVMLRSILSWTLRHRYLTCGIALLLVCSSLYCYRFLPQGFFPDMNYNQLYIEYKLPEGNTCEKVKKDLEEIRKYLQEKDYITNVTTSIGGTPSRYNLVRSIAEPSMSYGELIVDYKNPKVLVKTIDEIQNYLTDNYPNAYVRLKRYNLMYKKYPIELQFNGPDPQILKDLTAQAEEIMRNNPYTTLVCNNWEPEQLCLNVDYHQSIARTNHLGRSDMALSLLSATEGIPISSFYDGNYKQGIYLKSVDKNGNKIDNLNNTSIFGVTPNIGGMFNKETLISLANGSLSSDDIISEALKTIPLSQISKQIKTAWEDPVVVRYNGQRSMRAQCQAKTGISPETARRSLIKDIEKIELPDSYSYQWEGEYSASQESTAYLFKNFPLAIIMMIAILIFLFKDYKKPIIILTCIPLLLVGVVYGMLLAGKTFGFVAIVGVLGLIGMMIKNGIILMDEINEQLNSNIEPITALLNSSSTRFRPVMMASLTTILGMIPLLGDELFGPLAVTIMGGLFVGTLITLLFIPTLYAILFKLKIN